MNRIFFISTVVAMTTISNAAYAQHHHGGHHFGGHHPHIGFGCHPAPIAYGFGYALAPGWYGYYSPAAVPFNPWLQGAQVARFWQEAERMRLQNAELVRQQVVARRKRQEDRRDAQHEAIKTRANARKAKAGRA
jgi:hypothetical protein